MIAKTAIVYTPLSLSTFFHEAPLVVDSLLCNQLPGERNQEFCKRLKSQRLCRFARCDIATYFIFYPTRSLLMRCLVLYCPAPRRRRISECRQFRWRWRSGRWGRPCRRARWHAFCPPRTEWRGPRRRRRWRQRCNQWRGRQWRCFRR